MTAPGRYAASDNSFTKSTATAAARGGILIVIAIVIGVLLLWQGFDSDEPITTVEDETDETGDDAEEEEATPTTAGDDPEEVDTPTTAAPTTAAPVVVDPPNSVKVAVLNGRGEPGLAGARKDHLTTAGYVAEGFNADTFDKEFSRVYYTPGYEDEAELVAVALNGSPSVVERVPTDPLTLVADSNPSAADFNIYVVLGADAVLG
ncbi:MAG: LytR family transcriptional regulator [Acidimicrobiaceae bacterium]|nr:LytR family transcriptional regulator [Acidimicrobiaceae bacterium]MYG56526.1 LytR family transcriptional regulator [Acidimicrobiaceae bacterium]MYJ97509.1 LytR family transcriptional regulator [Acidimicrobiaceae bacterium]